MEDKSYFSKSVYENLPLCQLSISGDKSCSPFLVYRVDGETPSQRKIYALISGR